MRIAIFAIALALATQADAASVFKCKAADGTTVFSQRPCGGDAKEVVIRDHQIPQRPEGDDEPASPPPVNQALVDQAAYAERNSIDIRARNCRNAADANLRGPSNARIAQYQSRINALEADTRRANNNLAGATWEAGLRNEIASLHASISQEASSLDGLIASAYRTCDETQRREIDAFEDARRPKD